jgi:Outer membrane protein and related peptidoglycan-associated (lipo)proteins
LKKYLGFDIVENWDTFGFVLSWRNLMKKIILFCQLLLLINLFSQDGNIKKFNGLKRNIFGYSMADFDFQGYYKKIKEFEEKIENGDVKAMNNLANFYAKNDQIEQAEEYYKMAIQKGSKKAEKNLKILEKFPLMSDPMVMDDLAWDIPIEDTKGEIKIAIRGFKENGKDLNEYERNRMKGIVRKIWNKLYESADLEFIGYNDSTENKKLSLERAKRLAELFRESGLKDEMRIVKVLGKGSENPVDSNDTIAERYNNRRVEIIVKNVVKKNFDLSLLNELKNQLDDE